MTDSFGLYSLGDHQITAAGTYVGEPVTGLGATDAVTISARLAYGSGGATIACVVQTSLNEGQTWVDIARLDFATAGAEKLVTLSGMTPRTTPLVAAPLGAEGCNDGVLGDRLRAVLTTAGVYAGSTVVSIRAAVR